jgi:hypothetical protein
MLKSFCVNGRPQTSLTNDRFSIPVMNSDDK